MKTDYEDFKNLISYVSSIEQATKNGKTITFKEGEDIETLNKIANLEHLSPENHQTLIKTYKTNIRNYFKQSPMIKFNLGQFGVYFNAFPYDAYKCIRGNFRTDDEVLQFLTKHQNLISPDAFYHLLHKSQALAQAYFNKAPMKSMRVDLAFRLLADSYVFMPPTNDESVDSLEILRFSSAYKDQNGGNKNDLNYIEQIMKSILDLNQNALKGNKLKSKEEFVQETWNLRNGIKDNKISFLTWEDLRFIYGRISTDPIKLRFSTFVKEDCQNGQHPLTFNPELK